MKGSSSVCGDQSSVPSLIILFSNLGASILSFPSNPPTSPESGRRKMSFYYFPLVRKILFPSTPILRKPKIRESNLGEIPHPQLLDHSCQHTDMSQVKNSTLHPNSPLAVSSFLYFPFSQKSSKCGQDSLCSSLFCILS